MYEFELELELEFEFELEFELTWDPAEGCTQSKTEPAWRPDFKRGPRKDRTIQ